MLAKNSLFASVAIALCLHNIYVTPFVILPATWSCSRALQSSTRTLSSKESKDLKSEAAELLEKARQLRQSLPSEQSRKDSSVSINGRTSRWTVPESDTPGVSYRLYVDIGREQGTWMDPRWGASGKRIEFSLDVKFFTETVANQTVVDRMVKDNFGGTSSPVYELKTAPKARLRSGFDEMACYGGGYRIDTARNGASSTVRFHVLVDGTPESGSSYG